jgi:predicted DNA repair protein MutK
MLMATSLLLLLDDIASVLDDVSAMTKVAVKKTAGVLGDDLALNAKQVSGVSAVRELPVVWAVARGSAVNKLFLVPAALAIGWLTPWAVTPLLMIGGCYLCYEGAEKILHRLSLGSQPHGGGPGHDQDAATRPDRHRADVDASIGPRADPEATESAKIAGAIRTDFILSAEIIVITLGVVAGRPLVTQVAVLVAISVAMTVGVYGLVAGIVKLDDLGLLLAGRSSQAARVIGRGILAAAPWMMRGLSVAGTAAMFLVGGGIIAHGIPALHHAVHDLAVTITRDTSGGTPWVAVLSMMADAITGLLTGLGLAVVVSMGTRLIGPGQGPRMHA